MSTHSKSKPRVQNISCILAPSNEKGGLYLGNVYGAQNASILKEYGIRAVLTTSIETKIQYNPTDIVSHLAIQAHDKSDYHIVQHLEKCFQFIDSSRKYTNVYVHCYAGVSRSAAIVIAYLMTQFGWKLNKTLAFVVAKRIVVKPNQGFIKQLQEYEATLFPQRVNPSVSFYQQELRRATEQPPTSKIQFGKIPRNVVTPKYSQYSSPQQAMTTNSNLLLYQKHLYNQETNISFNREKVPVQNQMTPKPRNGTMQNQVTPKIRNGTVKSHQEIMIPEVIKGKENKPQQTFDKNRYLTYMSPGHSTRAYKLPKTEPEICQNFGKASSKISVTKVLQGKTALGKNFSTNKKDETVDNLSKVTSQGQLRPRDMPGYLNY